MKTVLVTGGAGFIGSHFVQMMAIKYPNWRFVTVDLLTYAGSINNLKELEKASNHEFIKADITDGQLMKDILIKHDFDYVVNFAAQTHVDNSINAPDIFVHTNVYGTQCLLSAAKEAWQRGTDGYGYPLFKEGRVFLQVSTDEVYGSMLSGSADERAPLLPNSPYAASKAAADLIVRSFMKTYRFPAIITRSSNNFGERQYPEKLIPLFIKLALADEKLPLYGDGLQKRDWIYVLDNARAIEKALIYGRPGEIYNIGTGQRRTNIDVITMILKSLGKPESLIDHVHDRLAHDFRYAIDTDKIRGLGWLPEHDFEEELLKTVEWYKKAYS